MLLIFIACVLLLSDILVWHFFMNSVSRFLFWVVSHQNTCLAYWGSISHLLLPFLLLEFQHQYKNLFFDTGNWRSCPTTENKHFNIHNKLSMEQETKITWQRNIITSWTPPSCWVAMDNKIPSKASVLSAIMLWNVFHVLKFENLPAKNFPATSNGRRFDRKHELVTSVANTIISSTKEKSEDM